MEKLLWKVLEKNKVSDSEYAKLMHKVDKVIEELAGSLHRLGYKAEIMLGGSAAKGTLLKGDFDCDIFVRFSPGSDRISDKLEQALKVFKDVARVHGSRDYFQMLHDGINYEFVPVIMIRKPGEAVNVTDVSPLHVSYIKEKIRKRPELKDQVLLAKIFCKAQKVYGAESYIGGFSGHVLDTLLICYGSFEDLLKAASGWKEGTVIDVEGYGSAAKLNRSKLSPLIVIDPIQKDRNAAAALTIEKFNLFRKKAAEFLRDPDERFFIIRKETDEELKRQADGNDLIILNAVPLKGKKDVVGGKILKVFNHIRRQLEINDFTVAGSGWDWQKDARLWFFVRKEKLSAEKTVEGPPARAKAHAKRFMEAHPGATEKDGRLYADIKRDFVVAKDLVRHLISGEYVKEKVKDIRIA